jgi:hypothetical protein
MLAGFSATLVLSWMPDTTGDVAERILPFVMAILIAASTSRKRGRDFDRPASTEPKQR